MAQKLSEVLPIVSDEPTASLVKVAPARCAIAGLSEAAMALDLASLPAELSNEQLALVREIASGPLPPLRMAEPKDVQQHLRVMDAALPRRARDENSGRLMVAAYTRMLSDKPAEALAFLTRTALAELDWFPTVKQCLAILSRFERRDEHTERKRIARNLEERELARRRELFFARLAAGELSQERIDQLPRHIVDEGRRRSLLRWDDDVQRFVLAEGSPA